MSGWVSSVDEMEKREKDQLLICLKLSHGNEISLSLDVGCQGPCVWLGARIGPRLLWEATPLHQSM